jgi:hypothetical protein
MYKLSEKQIAYIKAAIVYLMKYGSGDSRVFFDLSYLQYIIERGAYDYNDKKKLNSIITSYCKCKSFKTPQIT